jgi:hypothetical protein
METVLMAQAFHTDDALSRFPPLAERIRRTSAIVASFPPKPMRQPFALTDEQAEELATMTPGNRKVQLSILAYDHEYEQRRLIHHHGGPGLMPMYLELALANEWAVIRDARIAEAHAAFEASQMGRAA